MSITIIEAVAFLKEFGITDDRSYRRWVVTNHPDKVTDDYLKMQRTHITALITSHMAIAQDFFEKSSQQQEEKR